MDENVAGERRVFGDRRSANTCRPEVTGKAGGEAQGRDFPRIVKERRQDEKYQVALETFKWEQQLLYPLIKHYDDKEQTLMKEAYVLIALYASGVAAVFGLQAPTDPSIAPTISARSLDFLAYLPIASKAMLVAISVGFCLLSLILVKYIADTRCGCLVTMRQVNCIRQAIDALVHRAMDSVSQGSSAQPSEYEELYGQHRKLATNNIALRDVYNRNIIRSPDFFLVATIISINLMVFGVALFIAYETKTDSEKLSGLLSGAGLVLYVALLVWVYKSTKKKLQLALETNKK